MMDCTGPSWPRVYSGSEAQRSPSDSPGNTRFVSLCVNPQCTRGLTARHTSPEPKRSKGAIALSRTRGSVWPAAVSLTGPASGLSDGRRPYARNPRRNDKAVASVPASISEFGWRQPIVVNKQMVVLAGHA